MERRRDTPFLSQSVYDYIEPYLQSAAKKALYFALFVIQGIFTAVVITLISIILYILIYKRYVPKPTAREIIYFNYDLDPPKAYINLLRGERQWKHTFRHVPNNTSSTTKEHSSSQALRFLKSGFRYNFDMKVELAKSVRNYDLGKIVMSLDFLDSTHHVIAHAYHPIIMPYQSLAYVFIESMLLFPARFLQMVSTIESTSYSFTLVNDYIEPNAIYPSTAALELSLSTANIDLLSVELFIVPQLRGIVYYMYYYPVVSFSVGFSILWIAQFAFLTGFLSVIFIGRLIYSQFLAPSPERAEEEPEATPSAAEPIPGSPGIERADSVVSEARGDAFSVGTRTPMSTLSSLRRRRLRPNRDGLDSAFNRFSLRELGESKVDSIDEAMTYLESKDS